MMLDSIFNIPRKKEDLSSTNQGMVDLHYDEIQALRNITDTDAQAKFPGSQIIYRWDYSDGKWWLPSRSYVRIRCQLSKADGSMLENYDDIAPNMGMADSLFSQVSFNIADKTVQDISNNYPQCAAMQTRMSKTGQWLKTTGNELNFWENSFEKRKQDVIRNGGDLSEYGRGNGPHILSKTDLGQDNTTTIRFLAAGSRIEFAVNIGFLQENIRVGDVLVVKYNAEVYQRAFIILSIGSEALQVATFGQELGNIAATNLASWKIFKYGGARCSDLLFETNDPAIAANINEVTTLANYPNLGTLGDLFCISQPDAAVNNLNFYALLFYNYINNDNFSAGSFNPSIALAAAGGPPNNTSFFLKYDHKEIIDALNIGLLKSSDAANGHAVQIAVNATGDPILTFTALGTAIIPNNLMSKFRVGDFLNIRFEANGEPAGCIVSGIDPSNNGRSLSVIGSANLAANRGSINNATSHLRSIIRYGSPKEFINKAKRSKTFELIWRPKISIFDMRKAMPGGGKMEFIVVPYADTIYQKTAIESLFNNKVHGSANDYLFKVLDMRLYNCVCESEQQNTAEYMIDLQEVRCQIIPLTTPSRIQYSVDVSPSLNGVAIAFQDSDVINNTLYSNTKFKIRNNLELELREFYVRISQLQRPQPDYDLDYNETTNIDYMKNVYARNMLYYGGYHDSSQETLYEWRDRGMYMFWPIPRNATDRSTRCNVSTKFSSDTLWTDNGGITPNLLLFDFYKKTCIVKMDEGRISQIFISQS
jgi:hypothetical protein